MAYIERNTQGAEKGVYDIIVIGGGIHGVMMALEAGRRNLKCLLLEKSDFGGATSYNSLRIIHGGFRYLQNLNIARVRESASERRWYQTHFPKLVEPMPCLFPLYGNGLQRPLFFGPALSMYNLITRDRNEGISKERQLPPARLVARQRALELFPGLNPKGLKMGGVWYDAFMADSQRVLISCLLWATSLGVQALNYVRATGLSIDKGRVTGVCAVDEETGREHEFRSSVVINCAGPWCRELAAKFDKDDPSLFQSMLAWNVLFDRRQLSDYATAITSGDPGTHSYFSVPWKGKLLVGTGQAPWPFAEREPKVTEQQLLAFCRDLNKALPGMNFEIADIVTVYAGLQCATKPGGTEFTKRSVFIDHGKTSGPKGLFSLSGIKFTTARRLAEKTFGRIFPNGRNPAPSSEKPPSGEVQTRGVYPFEWFPDTHDNSWIKGLQQIIKEESVVHLEDLIFRRTSIGDSPQRALKLAAQISMVFGWDAERQAQECARIKSRCRERYFDAAVPDALPSPPIHDPETHSARPL
jgi:glycerol-3-phosphate dehydrogenase